MNVYFSASRFYRDEFAKNIKDIVEVLEKSDCRVLDNSVLRNKSAEDVDEKDRKNAYKQMLSEMNKCDVCVFEASHPSTVHIGHEITVAINKGKPVIILFTKGHEPIYFRGIEEAKIYWVEYDVSNLKSGLSKAIELAKSSIDVRFNFFVSPRILEYLDWVAKKRMIPRAVFLRELIEKEMKKDKGFGQE